MSEHYDNWERLVAAVLRKEHDRQLALSHSRDNTTISSSCSCHRSSSTTSQFDHDHSLLLLRPHAYDDQLPMDYSAPHYNEEWIKTMLPPSNLQHNPIGEEDDRWLREEQRWLREERRWLREECRWNSERQAFLQEINRLKLRVQQLERLNSIQGASQSDANIVKLLQVLKEGDFWNNANRIGDSGTSVVPLMVGAAITEDEVFVKEVMSIPETEEMVRSTTTLRKGFEGDEVCIPSSTKTLVATLGAPQDGIMTEDFLDRSFEICDSRLTYNEQSKSTYSDKRANGAPVTSSITDIKEEVKEVEVSEDRVVFVGENKEEPSRLYNGGSKKITSKSTRENATTKCFSCQGCL